LTDNRIGEGGEWCQAATSCVKWIHFLAISEIHPKSQDCVLFPINSPILHFAPFHCIWNLMSSWSHQEASCHSSSPG
jgi:hypothetical protein